MAIENLSWLTSVFTHAARDAGATADAGRLSEEASDLLHAWNDDSRTCHNTKFLIRVLDALDNLSGCAHAPDELQLAAFYHGAVFFTPRSLDYVHAGRDILAGARLAQVRLPMLGVPDDVTGRIVALIEAQASDEVPGDVDVQVLHDALLATLTMPPQDYKDYRARMCGQYSHLPRRLYLLGRRRQVKSLLDQPAIFLSPLAADDDEIARSNLASELNRLNQEIGDGATDADSDSEVVTTGPTSGTIMIKKVKAKLRAAESAEDEEGGAATPPPPPEPAPPVETAPTREVSSLEAIEDDLDDFAGAHTSDPRAREDS